MKFFIKRIIIISILIIVFSIFDILDDSIISIFNFEDEGLFEVIIDLSSPLLTIALMFWIFLTGKKYINLIRDEEEQYKRLVQFSPEAIIIHKEGKILFINNSGANLFGSSSPRELINRNISEFLHHDSIALFKEQLDESTNSEFYVRVQIKRIDGATICSEFKSTNIDFKGQAVSEIIARDITIQQKEIETVKRLAYQDVLTGLPNRRAFMDQLTQLLKSSEDPKMNFGVMFIDLDGFKQVNDTLGHDGGDILLKQVSESFKECVAKQGTVARLAGDEFIILLHKSNKTECTMVAKKIIESLSSPIMIFGRRVRVTPSIGIALYPKHGHEASELISKADMAMYQAKTQGKNNYRIYEPSTIC